VLVRFAEDKDNSVSVADKVHLLGASSHQIPAELYDRQDLLEVDTLISGSAGLTELGPTGLPCDDVL
jgi:hypothetical protein